MVAKTDRYLLINGLAQVNGATDSKTWGTKDVLELGNMHLHFDKNEKLVRIRIMEDRGRGRTYVVREPQENVNV